MLFCHISSIGYDVEWFVLSQMYQVYLLIYVKMLIDPPKSYTLYLKRKNSHLKVQSVILIQYTFCQTQQIAPYGPLAVHSVCALKNTKL